MKKWVVGVLLLAICNIALGETLTKLDKQMVAARFSSEIDFKDVALSDALSVLSKSTGVTMVADSSAKETALDLYIGRGKNLKEVVDTLKVTNNLKTKVVGDVLVFSKRSGAAVGDNTLVGKVTAEGYESGLNGVSISLLNSGLNPIKTQYKGMFIMESVNPGIYILKAEIPGYEVAGELIEVKGAQNNFIEIQLKKEYPEGYTGTGEPVDDSGVKGRLLGQVRDESGGELITERITLKHAFPEDVKNVLESSLREIEVAAFDKLNMVIIKGTPSNLVPAKKLIEDLDTPLKQVRITAQILDVTDNLFESLGFDWYYDSNGTLPKDSNGNTINQGTSGTGLESLGRTLGIGNVFSTNLSMVRTFNGGDDVLGVAVNMLQSTQDLAISAVPSIVIVNGEEAEFKITDEVIVGQEEVEEDNDITRTTPLFEEAGLIFKVKPTIREGVSEEDTILLSVDTEVSNFNLKDDGTTSNGGTFNEDGGSKSIRNITTRVTVKSGESLFIGGLKRAEVANTVSKVPLLGDLPGIGFLFRKEGVSNEMRDIFIKIKAEIVTVDNAQTDIDLKGFKNTELHRMERDIRDHRKIYPRIPATPQILGTPNLFSE